MTLDSQKIKVGIIMLLGTFAALYLGIAAATAQLEAIAWVAGVLSLAVGLTLGRRIWLIIPILSAISFRVPLPGTFSTLLLAQMATIGFLGLLFLMRKLPMRFAISELEIWCILFTICVVQVYLRNPVGLNIFGSSTVGGRPYFEFAIGLITAGLISTLVINPKDLVWWVRLTLIGSMVNFVMGLITVIFPSMGYIFMATYMSDVTEEGATQAADTGRAGRVSYLRGISYTLALWICSRMSPLRACLHPVWAPLVFFTLAASAYSGYRSQIAGVGLVYFIGLCYRGGMPHVILSSVAAALAIVLLAFVNLIAPLPANIQRSLTFLPGTWEQIHKDDAKQSSDWRTEIWIEALTNKSYIRNTLIGDGLGMTSDQLQRSLALKDSTAKGIGGWDSHRESILISGDYHSGPVSTIRTVGYLGLAVLLAGMIRVAVHAHRQILRCRGTEWYATALFLGIPIIGGPISWVFIFGSFEMGAASLFMGTAMVRLMEKNLPLPAYMARRAEHLPLAVRERSQGTGGRRQGARATAMNSARNG
jgi:hypothetical protein